MKLKLLLIIGFMAISITGMSQALWIVIFGDKLSTDRMQSGINISVGGIDFVGLSKAKPAINWAIGGFSEIRINKENLYFAFDFTIKSPLGARNLISYFPNNIADSTVIKTQDIIMDNIAISLPLYIKYQTKLIGIGIGPQLSYIYKSNLKYKAESHEGHNILIKQDSKDNIHRFDAGAFAMLEAYITPNHHNTSMRVGIRYYYGFLEPLKDFSGVHNNSLLATISIPIGGKSKIKQE